MTAAEKSARRLLAREIPPDILERIDMEKHLHLVPGATLKDALDAVVAQKAAEGDLQAAALVKRYGLD